MLRSDCWRRRAFVLGKVPGSSCFALSCVHHIGPMRPQGQESGGQSGPGWVPMRVLLVHRQPEPGLVRLLREGHDVLAVRDEERSIRSLGVFRAELVLVATDDPVTICHAVRRAAPGISTLVLLPTQSLDSRVAALDAGADDCLGRPFAREELAARMRAAQRRRQPRASVPMPTAHVPMDGMP
jgi:CheY-like chemotaxis protein